MNNLTKNSNKSQLKPRGYYNNEENVKRDLISYIEERKEHVYFKHSKIWHGIISFAKKNNEDRNKCLERILAEIGYTKEAIMKPKPWEDWNDINNVIKEVEKFISVYQMFPNQNDFSKVCKIGHRALSKHGGITKLKEIMNYDDKKDRIDKNGNYHDSKSECMLANYLISRNIHVKRKCKPFEKHGYLSDGLIRKVGDNKEYHIELWGHRKDEKTKQAITYNETRKKKRSYMGKMKI